MERLLRRATEVTSSAYLEHGEWTPVREMLNQNWPDEVIFSPDGSKLLANSWAAISWYQWSRLWDVPSGSEIATFRDHTSDTHGAAFSHDGRLIATVSLDGTARLWDGISGKRRGSLGQETAGLKLGQMAPGPRSGDELRLQP